MIVMADILKLTFDLKVINRGSEYGIEILAKCQINQSDCQGTTGLLLALTVPPLHDEVTSGMRMKLF